MSALTQSPAWQALAAQREQVAKLSLADLFAADPGRAQRFALEAEGLYADFSRQHIDAHTLQLLAALTRQAGLSGWTERMFAGEKINASEDRAALHVALRASAGDPVATTELRLAVRKERERMLQFATEARAGKTTGATGKPLRAFVHLGTGGSDLGPRLAVRALRRQCDDRLAIRFAANLDPADLDAALTGLDPATTCFILASKSFATLETMENAARARAWLAQSLGSADLSRHFVALTAHPEAARAWGVSAEHIFLLWDWVGGRFSLWSVIGLPLALAAGSEAFLALLDGARAMDLHFRTAPAERNLPLLLALVAIWNVNFLGCASQAVLPYSEDLRDLPAYLQQLEMESNGKRIDRDGNAVDYATAPVLWGAAGTVSQHSFHQFLHQGTQTVPADFIVPLDGSASGQDRLRIVNALAQAAALAEGERNDAAPHRACPGNRPSTTLLMDALSPRTLGALLAAWEHKVFAQSVIWNINPFDQWGVELGKRLAGEFAAGAHADRLDAATRMLLGRLPPG